MDSLSLISPAYVGEERIVLRLSPATEVVAYRPITVEVDYSGAGEPGVCPPLEIVVQPAWGTGGRANGYRLDIYDVSLPTAYTFSVPGAGTYLCVVRERFHNRWWGRLLVEVGGDPFNRILSERE